MAQDDNVMEQEAVGVGGESCAHEADIFRFDHERIARPFGKDIALWDDARVVTNMIEAPTDLLDPVWSSNATTPVLVPGVGPNGEDAWEFDITANQYFRQQIMMYESRKYNASAIMRIKPGTPVPTTQLNIYYAGRTATVTRITLTDEWKYYAAKKQGDGDYATSDDLKYVGIRGAFGDEIATMQLVHLQHEDISGQSNETPASPVIGTQVFGDTNGNTADTNDNIIVENKGALLDPIPMLAHQFAAANYVPQSQSIDLWNARGTALINQTLIGARGDANGAASVTVSSGTNDVYSQSGVIAGAVDLDPMSVQLIMKQGSDTVGTLEFRGQFGSAAGFGRWYIDVALLSPTEWEVVTHTHPAVTVNAPMLARGGGNQLGFRPQGDVDPINFHLANALIMADIGGQIDDLGPIFTGVDAVATDEPIYDWVAANHDDGGDIYEGYFRVGSGDKVLLSIGGVTVLERVNADIILKDGVNQCLVPVITAIPYIQVYYGPGGMTLNVDGNTDSSPYDGTLGSLGGISTQCTLRDLKRIGSVPNLVTAMGEPVTHNGRFVVHSGGG